MFRLNYDINTNNFRHKIVDIIDGREFTSYYLHDYYPVNRFTDVDENIKITRKFIWSFKDGITFNLVGKVVATCIQKLDLDLSNTIILIIPASDQKKTEKRFKYFCQIISQILNVENGFSAIMTNPHIPNKGKINVNKIENFIFNPKIYTDKKVILIDDVRTSGESFRQVTEQLINSGAQNVTGIFIAKTVYNNESSTQFITNIKTNPDGKTISSLNKLITECHESNLKEFQSIHELGKITFNEYEIYSFCRSYKYDVKRILVYKGTVLYNNLFTEDVLFFKNVDNEVKLYLIESQGRLYSLKLDNGSIKYDSIFPNKFDTDYFRGQIFDAKIIDNYLIVSGYIINSANYWYLRRDGCVFTEHDSEYVSGFNQTGIGNGISIFDLKTGELLRAFYFKDDLNSNNPFSLSFSGTDFILVEICEESYIISLSELTIKKFGGANYRLLDHYIFFTPYIGYNSSCTYILFDTQTKKYLDVIPFVEKISTEIGKEYVDDNIFCISGDCLVYDNYYKFILNLKDQKFNDFNEGN